MKQKIPFERKMDFTSVFYGKQMEKSSSLRVKFLMYKISFEVNL
jgi:hypothetical protein